MTQISLDQLSDQVNAPILHYPGRRFPGVLIQGDTLQGFAMMAEAVVEALDQSDLQIARDEAEELRDKLRVYLDHYNRVLRDHGMQSF
jgi:hypothetical protein